MTEKSEAQKAIDEMNAQREKHENRIDWIAKIKPIAATLILAIGAYSIFIYKNPNDIKPSVYPNQKLIEKQFNALHGDHLKLRVNSKNSLKFPDTYEHIETKYWDNKESESITVKSYFNGKNAFGVPQKQCLIATYSYSGTEIKPPEVCF